MNIKNIKFVCAAALMAMASGSVLAQPTIPAPAPTAAQDDVISIFCNSFTPNSEWSFGEWGSGTTWTDEVIGNNDNVAKFVTTGAGYFGWQFADKNVKDFDTLHLDIWAENDCTVNYYVISKTEGDVTQDKISVPLTLKANQWNVFDLSLSTWSANNLERVFQFKFADMPNQTIYIDNVYFEKVAVEDDEAPEWAIDPAATVSATSATVTATAIDNVTRALTYEISATTDFATIADTSTGMPGARATMTVKGLTPNTEYTYYVRVKDAAGNVGEVKTVTFTTSDGPVLEEVTYYGTAGGADLSQWLDKVDGYYPVITYTATTTSTNQMVFNIKLSEVVEGLVAELWCDQAKSYASMTQVPGTTDEFTATIFDEFEKNRGDQINFRFRFPMPGGAPMTQNIYMNIGDSNAKPDADVTAPTWNADPTTQNVADQEVELVVNLTDDSGVVTLTITGDNGFAETVKSVSANGTDQVIKLSGLTAKTTYNLSIAVKDAAGNEGDAKNVSFTTAEAPSLDVLYQTIDFVSADWTKNGGDNTFAPNGSIQIAVNADNTVTMTVKVDEDADLIDNSQCILHGIDTFWLTLQDDNTFVGTSAQRIANRDASQPFHLNFVLKNGKGNSEYKVTYFTPSAGTTSAVARVDADGVKVVAADGVIRVDGRQFAVYTIAGQQVYNGAGEARLDRGAYVVVFDGKAVKVML